MALDNVGHKRIGSGFKIIPVWAWTLAAISCAGVQIFCDVFWSMQPKGPPVWAGVAMGLVAGLLLGCFFLLLGYVNRDSRRRGMSPALWTCVVLLIPNGLGFLLYFILRQPISVTCPQCGNPVQPGTNFCPKCRCRLSASCPQCQRAVGLNDVYCPNCGAPLSAHAVAADGVATSVQS